MPLEKKNGAGSWFWALKDDYDNVVPDLNGILDDWLSFIRIYFVPNQLMWKF